MVNAPILNLATASGFRVAWTLTLGEVTENQTPTAVEVEISKSDTFTTLEASETATTLPVTFFQYLVPSADATATFYARARTVADIYDPLTETTTSETSAWSATSTAVPPTAPVAPVLEQRISAPQRIAVGAMNPTPDLSRIVFEVSKASDFNPVVKEFVIEGGPALIEYRVPETDRDTTHYIRAKSYVLTDFDETLEIDLFLESAWSSTLTVSAAGKIASVDIESLTAGKISSGTLTSNIVIGGRIIAGRDPDLNTGGYVEMKGTGIEWVPDGKTNPSVILPATGSAVFSGVSVNASEGLDAKTVTLRGTIGVADSAVATLSAGNVADPSTPASITSVWPTAFTTASESWQGAHYDSAGTAFWFAHPSGARSYSSTGTADKNFSLGGSGWTTRTTPVPDTLNSIEYSDAENQWVAVGDSGVILTSGDGTTWTSRTSNTTNILNGVARSENDDLWVAVGASGTIRTSSDGTTWTSRTSGSTKTLTGIARSEADDLWVAVGRGSVDGVALTSSDGITWSSNTISSSKQIYAVARSESEDLWVAVGNGAIFTSPNGTTWTSRTSPTIADIYGVGRNDSKDLWIAVGYGGGIYTSPDGTTWTSRTSGTSNSLRSVAYSEAEGIWVVVGDSGTVLTSTDGITWTARTSGTTSQLRGLSRSEEKDLWVAVGWSVITSPDAGVGMSAITGIAVGTGDASTSRLFAISNGVLARFNKTTGAQLQEVSVSTYSSKAARASLFYDDGKVKVITQDAVSSGKIQLVSYTPGSLTTAPTTTTLDSGFTGNFSFYGAARFTVSSTDYYAIALTDTSGRSGVYCFKVSDGTRASTYDFADSQGNVPGGGLAYDGTRFFTLATPTSTALEKHSTWHPGAATQSTFVRYSFANATNETKVSPAATLNLSARGYLSIVLPSIPDAASKVRVYVRGAATDSTSAYKKISSGDENTLTYTYGDVDLTTSLTTDVGALGPWSAETGTPASMKSASTGWELLGSGVIQLSERTEPSAPGADKAVLFLKDNGSGKTQLCVKFNTGAVQVLATQP